MYAARWRKRIILLCLTLVSFLASGCDQGSPVGADTFDLSSLAGVWEVTEFGFISNDDPEMVFDLVAAGGSTTISIQPQGTFTGSVFLPDALTGQGDLTIPVSGIMRLVEDDCIRVDFIPELPPLLVAMHADFEVLGDELVLSDPNRQFDFDEDGTTEPATLIVRGVRH